MYYRRRNSWFTLKLMIIAAVVMCVGLLLIAIPQLVRSIIVVATYPIVQIRNVAVTAVQPFFTSGQAEKDATIATLQAALEEEKQKNNQSENDDTAARLVVATSTDSEFDTASSTASSTIATATATAQIQDAETIENEFDEDFMKLGGVVFAPPYSITDRLVIRLATDDGEGDQLMVSSVLGKRAYVKVAGMYVPVGTIESSDAVTAAVTLYSLPDRQVLVRFGTSTTVHTVTGYGGGVLSGQLPKALTVDAGDRVLLAQDGEVTFMGAVRYVERDDSNPLDRIFISLPLSPLSLSEIYVERP